MGGERNGVMEGWRGEGGRSDIGGCTDEWIVGWMDGWMESFI